MNKNISFSLLIFFVFMACNRPLVAPFKEFEKLLYEIDSKVGELTTPASLFNIDKFVLLSQNAQLHFENSLSVLANEKYSTQQKIICIFIMQHLKKEKYLDFIKYGIKLYNQNKIEEYLLLLMIKPQIKQEFQDDKRYNQKVTKLVLKIKRKSNYFDNLIEELQAQ